MHLEIKNLYMTSLEKYYKYVWLQGSNWFPKLVEVLKSGRHNVTYIHIKTRCDQSEAARRLGLLNDLGLVIKTREGKFVFCEYNYDGPQKLRQNLIDDLQRNIEFERSISHRNPMLNKEKELIKNKTIQDALLQN